VAAPTGAEESRRSGAGLNGAGLSGGARGSGGGRRLLRTLLQGSLVAAGLALSSWAVASLAFGTQWRFSILLGFTSASAALIAWFLHLGADGFLRPRADEEAERRRREEEARSAAAIGPLAHPELSLFAPRDGGLVPRAGEPRSSLPPPEVSEGGPAVSSASSPRPAKAQDAAPDAGKAARDALAVAAIELALLSALLYSLAGVGARYFL
jgi:hypothetical protein